MCFSYVFNEGLLLLLLLSLSVFINTGTDGTVPECLMTSLYALNSTSMHGFEAAIRANIYVGGDNVCRAWIIGEIVCVVMFGVCLVW